MKVFEFDLELENSKELFNSQTNHLSFLKLLNKMTSKKFMLNRVTNICLFQTLPILCKMPNSFTSYQKLGLETTHQATLMPCIQMTTIFQFLDSHLHMARQYWRRASTTVTSLLHVHDDFLSGYMSPDASFFCISFSFFLRVGEEEQGLLCLCWF